MKKFFGPIFLTISVVATLAMILNKPEAVAQEAKKNTPFVKTMLLVPQSVNALISSQGFVKPKSDLNLISELSTRVEWVSSKMESGSSFEKGDTLVILDKRDYELALITAEADVLNAKLNLERERAESDLASKEWSRVGGGTGSALALRKPQLAQANATLSAANANLERARRNLNRSIFIAPFKGRVKSKNTDVGATVFPGTLLGNIYAIDVFEIHLPIADQDVSFTGLDFNGQEISIEKQLEVTFSFGGKNITGKVVRAEAEVNSKTRMLSVVASLDAQSSNGLNPILIGQYAQASIKGVEVSDVYVIARNYIRNESIWVVDENMTLMNRPINVIRYENEFALVGEGIETGDRLLTSRLSSLINGQKVTFSLK